jgi:hypothetical protein
MRWDGQLLGWRWWKKTEIKLIRLVVAGAQFQPAPMAK